jgi:hypothetical protein
LPATGGAGVIALAGCLGDGEAAVASYTVVFPAPGGARSRHPKDEKLLSAELADEKLLSAELAADVNIAYAREVGRCGQCV